MIYLLVTDSPSEAAELVRQMQREDRPALTLAEVFGIDGYPPEPVVAEGSDTGAAIRAIRNRAGLSLDEVSVLAGISPSYLSRAENGIVSPTSAWIEMVTVAIGLELARKESLA